MTQDAEEEQPLDPELEMVRRRLLRLFVVAIGIMGISLFAVLGAILYRLGSSPPPAPDEAQSGAYDIVLPAGARVTASHVDAGMLVLELAKADGSQSFLVLDLKSGETRGRIEGR